MKKSSDRSERVLTMAGKMNPKHVAGLVRWMAREGAVPETRSEFLYEVVRLMYVNLVMKGKTEKIGTLSEAMEILKRHNLAPTHEQAGHEELTNAIMAESMEFMEMEMVMGQTPASQAAQIAQALPREFLKQFEQEQEDRMEDEVGDEPTDTGAEPEIDPRQAFFAEMKAQAERDEMERERVQKLLEEQADETE